MSTHEFIDSVITHTLQLCAVLVLVLVVVHHDEAEQAVRHTVQVALGTDQAQVQVVQEQTPITVTDMGDEVWWTTTDCPTGVPVPCLDPTLTPAQVATLPADVQAQYAHLGEAEWQCIGGHGVPVPSGDEQVYVPAPVLSLCRAAAYAVVAQPANAAVDGCWLENLGSTELPAWTWLSEVTSDGLCPGSI